MLAHSTRDRSRSPPTSQSLSSSMDHPSGSIESNGHSQTAKAKKENEVQQRLRSLKSFIQTLINESTSINATYEDQMKALEGACLEEYRDLSLDRIRRMIRSLLKLRKPHPSTPSAFLHQDHKTVLPSTSDRFNPSESSSSSKKSRSNPSSTPKNSDLITPPVSSLSALDADFLRHAFSQQFRPSLDLSAYFPATASTSNGTGPTSPLFRPNFSPSNFLQSLTNSSTLVPPPPPPTALASSHPLTNGNNDSSTITAAKPSKQGKMSSSESSSIRVLVNAYREAASYLCRSADELEQMI